MRRALRIVGRLSRFVTLGILTLLASLSAVSLVTYANYGRVFEKTTGAAASYLTVFSAASYAVWRFCGGKRQFDLDSERSG